MRRVWIGLVVTTVAVVGLASPGAAAKTPPKPAPKGCLAALKAANSLHVGYELRNVNYDDAMQEISRALTTTSSFTVGLNGVTDAVNKLSSELRAVNPGIDTSRAQYEAAARKCTAGR